jgi:glycosyltransferase involved in cell wall biosynthesis
LVFAETNEEMKDCLNFGLKDIQVLNNGIDFRNYDNLPSRSIFRNKYGIKDDDILILFMGRINEIKGLRYLVESVSNLRNFPEIKLVIIGPDDRYLSKLLNLIKKLKLTEKVIIIEGLYGMDKVEAYSASDIFCLPSIYDCCPNSMLEACAAGLPIITTKTNGLSCLLENGGGIVVSPGNTESIKKALLYFVQNPDRIKDCGLHLKKIVSDNYNWDNTANIIESYYYKYLN